MRQFIAIPLPKEVKQSIEKISVPFQGMKGIKLVKTENLHLTLLFIGDKGSDEDIDKLRNISFKPFRLSSISVELFPERKPRLIWVGLKKPQELAELHSKIAGVFGAEEELRAHITIGRIKWLSGENKKALIEKTEQLNPYNITFDVSHFNLYSSELKPGGPEYQVVESFSAAPAGE